MTQQIKFSEVASRLRIRDEGYDQMKVPIISIKCCFNTKSNLMKKVVKGEQSCFSQTYEIGNIRVFPKLLTTQRGHLCGCMLNFFGVYFFLFSNSNLFSFTENV